MYKTRSKRKREPAVLSFEESERRALLHKDWTRYKMKQHINEIMAVTRVRWSQQRALEELRKESEELYQSAIQVCCNGSGNGLRNVWFSVSAVLCLNSKSAASKKICLMYFSTFKCRAFKYSENPLALSAFRILFDGARLSCGCISSCVKLLLS